VLSVVTVRSAVCAALLLACTRPAAPTPPASSIGLPIRVHVDHAKDAPAAAEWEAARRQYLAWLAAAGERELPTLVIEDDQAHTYYLLRPFAALHELDDLRARQGAADDRAEAKAGGDAWKRNEARFHAALAPPHYSEVWTVIDHDALARLAAGDVWFVDSAEVMPPDEEAYGATLIEIDRAVAPSGYQRRVDVDVVYGSGRWLSIWPEATGARAPHDVAVSALGDAGAQAIDARRAAASQDLRRATWRVRRDLSSWP
jgi:hypothetical protein